MIIQFDINFQNNQNTYMITINDIFEESTVNINSKGRLAFAQFTYSYAKTLISKCICSGSLKENKLNTKDLLAIYDSENLISQPSIAADLQQRRQKTIEAANQNRLDDYEFKESLSISFDKVNLLEGIQTIRLKKFNSIHLMITKNEQLVISAKQEPASSSNSSSFSSERASDQPQAATLAGIEGANQGDTQQSESEAEVSESSNEDESMSQELLPLYLAR